MGRGSHRRSPGWWRAGSGTAVGSGPIGAIAQVAVVASLAVTACAGGDGEGGEGGSADPRSGDGGGGGGAPTVEGGPARGGARPASPDSAALATAFDGAAEAAYDQAGRDRERQHTEGVVLDGCFALDADGVTAIVEALGHDPGRAELFPGGNFLQGVPGRDERLACSVALHGGEGDEDEDDEVLVTVGVVDREPTEILDEMRDLAQRGGRAFETIEGRVPGLPADQVIAVDQEGGEHLAFAWVDGGFRVALGIPGDVAAPEAGFRALGAAVDVVARTLPRAAP